MNRFNLLGLITVAAGGIMVLFEAISSMMNPGEVVFKSSSLVDLMGEDAFLWIDNISVAFLQNALNSLVTLPTWMLLVGLGVICFIIGGLTSR